MSRERKLSKQFAKSIFCSEKFLSHLRSKNVPDPNPNNTINAFPNIYQRIICSNITSTPENNLFTKIWKYDYTSAGIIVGIIFAAIFGLAILTAITCCFIKKKNQRGRVIQPAQRGDEFVGPVTSNIFIVPSGAPPPAYSSQGYTQPYSPYAGYSLAPSAPVGPGYNQPGGAPLPPAYSQAAMPPPAYSSDPAYPPQGGAYSTQGGAYPPQGGAFSPQGGTYPPGTSGAPGGAYPPQGNMFGK